MLRKEIVDKILNDESSIIVEILKRDRPEMELLSNYCFRLAKGRIEETEENAAVNKVISYHNIMELTNYIYSEYVYRTDFSSSPTIDQELYNEILITVINPLLLRLIDSKILEYHPERLRKKWKITDGGKNTRQR